MADIDWSRETRITLTDSDGNEISVENNIVAGTLILDEIIVSGNIVFGLPCANRFEVQLYNIVANDITDYHIKVTQTDENETENDLFRGIIESAAKNDNDVVWKVIAYDEFYDRRNVNVAEWWTAFWTGKESSTLKELRQSLLAYVHLEETENVTLINENKSVRKNIEISSMTFSDMFTSICELSAVFPNMNKSGKIEYVQLDGTAKDISGKYETGNSKVENIQSQAITGIQVYDSGNELKYTYGNAGNTYMYSGNIFMMDMSTEELQSVCADIYSSVQKIAYHNSSIKMIVSDLSYTVGDLISTDKGDFYIFENLMSGSQLVEQTISASGNMNFGDAPSTTRDFTITNEKIARVKETVEGFMREYYDPETGNDAKLEMTANQIKSTVGTAEDKYRNSIEIKPESEWDYVYAIRQIHYGIPVSTEVLTTLESGTNGNIASVIYNKDIDNTIYLFTPNRSTTPKYSADNGVTWNSANKTLAEVVDGTDGSFGGLYSALTTGNQYRPIIFYGNRVSQESDIDYFFEVGSNDGSVLTGETILGTENGCKKKAVTSSGGNDGTNKNLACMLNGVVMFITNDDIYFGTQPYDWNTDWELSLYSENEAIGEILGIRISTIYCKALSNGFYIMRNCHIIKIPSPTDTNWVHWGRFTRDDDGDETELEMVDIAYGNNIYVAVGYSTMNPYSYIFKKTTGSWEIIDNDSTMPPPIAITFVESANCFFLVTRVTTTRHETYYSQDGITWMLYETVTASGVGTTNYTGKVRNLIVSYDNYVLYAFGRRLYRVEFS